MFESIEIMSCIYISIFISILLSFQLFVIGTPTSPSTSTFILNPSARGTVGFAFSYVVTLSLYVWSESYERSSTQSRLVRLIKMEVCLCRLSRCSRSGDCNCFGAAAICLTCTRLAKHYCSDITMDCFASRKAWTGGRQRERRCRGNKYRWASVCKLLSFWRNVRTNGLDSGPFVFRSLGRISVEDKTDKSRTRLERWRSWYH